MTLTKEQKARFDEMINEFVSEFEVRNKCVPYIEQFLASELELHDKELIMAIDKEINAINQDIFYSGSEENREAMREEASQVKGLEFAKKKIEDGK